MPKLRVPVLQSERLRLEPLSQAHSHGMFALWSDAKVCVHSGPATDSAGLSIALPAKTRHDSDRLLEFWLDRARQGTGFRWAVVLRDRDEFAGAVGFNSLGGCSEYAYHIVPRFWGLGLAGEASGVALAWSFAGGAELVECFIEPANVASIRLVERLGFQRADVSTGETCCYRLARASQPLQA